MSTCTFTQVHNLILDDYLGLQPLSLRQELCGSSGHGGQAENQPPAGRQPEAEREAPAERPLIKGSC